MAEHSKESGLRKLAAIMFTDIKGFSKKMAKNEVAAFELLQTHDALLRTVAAKHDGKVVKSIGDSLMVDFASAVNALEAAVDSQIALWSYNKGKDEFNRIEVRIGLHLGDVMVAGNDMYGDGVNIASRIQSITQPTRICISSDLYSQVKNKTDAEFFRIGDISLKNIPQPVAIYEVLIPSIPELAQPSSSAQQTLSEEQLELGEEREARKSSELEAAKWQEHLRAQKVDEEKEKKVREHYEHAGEYIRDGQFDLAENEIREIFKIYPIHMGAQQLQSQIEEERYKKAEQERQKKIDEKRKIDDEKEQHIRRLSKEAEQLIEKGELEQARTVLETIRSQSRAHASIRTVEEHLQKAELDKAETERKKALLEEENRKQEQHDRENEQKRQRYLDRSKTQQDTKPSRKPRKVLVGGIAVIMILIVVGLFAYPRLMSLVSPSSNTMAILPFGSLQDRTDEMAMGSMVQELLQGYLSRFEDLVVVSPSRTRANENEIARLATKLKVRYVIHGNVKITGTSIKVHIGMSDADQGAELLSEELSGEIAALPKTVAQSVSKILDQLSIEGSAVELETQTSNARAYELYAKGVYFLKHDSIDFAEQCFLEAEKADSLFAPAFGRLSELVAQKSQQGTSVDGKLLNDAIELEHKAAILNAQDPSCYRSSAEISLLTQRFNNAAADIKSCLSVQPKDPSCYRMLAQLALVGGNNDLALSFASKSIRFDPDDADNQLVLGIAHALRKEYALANGSLIAAVTLGESDSLITTQYLLSVWSGQDRYNDIIQYSQKILATSHNDFRAYYWISRAYQMMPNVVKFKESSDTAMAMLQGYLERNPQDALASAYLGLIYARKGKSNEAVAAMKKAAELDPHSIEIGFREADMYAILGKQNEAFSTVKAALAKDFNFSEILDVDLNFVRNETGFTSATTRQINLENFPTSE